MSSTNDEDPFLQVQGDVLSLLNNTRPLFSSYLRIRSSASSPSSLELIEARNELEANLRDLSTDLEDLVESVKAVERDTYRYRLDVTEVSRRRRLVEDVGAEIEDMRAELIKTVTTTRQNWKGIASFDGQAHDSDAGYAADEYAAFEQERQQEMMHEQDTALDGVFKTVGNLRQQADDMGRELEEQAVILDDVDTLADRVGGKLQQGIKRVGWVIRKNEDTMSSCCIAVLIFALVVLLILVIVL